MAIYPSYFLSSCSFFLPHFFFNFFFLFLVFLAFFFRCSASCFLCKQITTSPPCHRPITITIFSPSSFLLPVTTIISVLHPLHVAVVANADEDAVAVFVECCGSSRCCLLSLQQPLPFQGSFLLFLPGVAAPSPLLCSQLLWSSSFFFPSFFRWTQAREGDVFRAATTCAVFILQFSSSSFRRNCCFPRPSTEPHHFFPLLFIACYGSSSSVRALLVTVVDAGRCCWRLPWLFQQLMSLLQQ